MKHRIDSASRTGRPEGYVTISRFTGDDGRIYTAEQARQFGWVKPGVYIGPPPGWGIGGDELCLGPNLFTDAGRQLLAYCFGSLSPVQDYVVTYFSLGTGNATPKVTDVALQNPLVLAQNPASPAIDTDYLSHIDGVTYTAPFIASVLFTLGGNMGNGRLLTEFGLHSGNGTLYARRISLGINKSAEFSPQLSWRIRF